MKAKEKKDTIDNIVIRARGHRRGLFLQTVLHSHKEQIIREELESASLRLKLALTTYYLNGARQATA